MSEVNSSRREFVQATIAVAVVSATSALPGVASAQAYPSRPIKLICPWPAGGSTDAVMRALAESVGKALGGSVVVENKPGASGMLGPNELAKAAPTKPRSTSRIADSPFAALHPYPPFDFVFGALTLMGLWPTFRRYGVFQSPPAV